MRKIGGWAVAAVIVGGMLLGTPAGATESGDGGSPGEKFEVYRKVGLGAAAAFAIALSVLGAAYAVARIGAAAMGAAAEKPELLNRSLLFVALAEGLAVLGFVIAMMLIQKM